LRFIFLFIECVHGTECWNADPHVRPSFSTVLESLQLIAQSSFVETPNPSFHGLQDDWRHEIEFMFEELKSKEQVSDLLCCLLAVNCKCYAVAPRATWNSASTLAKLLSILTTCL